MRVARKEPQLSAAAAMIGHRAAGQDAARLEEQADAILARDAELLRELGVHADALRRCYEELMLPRNDPQYLATLEAHEKDRVHVANLTNMIHHTVADGRPYLTIGMTNARNHAAAAKAARVLGRHFEAPVIRHEDPKDLTRFADHKQGQRFKPTSAFSSSVRIPQGARSLRAFRISCISNPVRSRLFGGFMPRLRVPHLEVSAQS